MGKKFEQIISPKKIDGYKVSKWKFTLKLHPLEWLKFTWLKIPNVVKDVE